MFTALRLPPHLACRNAFGEMFLLRFQSRRGASPRFGPAGKHTGRSNFRTVQYAWSQSAMDIPMHTMMPISPRQFVTFRIVLGVYLGVHFAQLIPFGVELFSD